jgi:hypothetical protein
MPEGEPDRLEGTPLPDQIVSRDVLGFGRMAVRFRLDTHIPLVFALIHPGRDPAGVFEAVDTLVSAAQRFQHSVTAEIPFSTLNAPHLDLVVRWLAKRGIVHLRLVDLEVRPPLSHLHDPQQHMTVAWQAWAVGRAAAEARQRGVTFEVAIRTRLPDPGDSPA